MSLKARTMFFLAIAFGLLLTPVQRQAAAQDSGASGSQSTDSQSKDSQSTDSQATASQSTNSQSTTPATPAPDSQAAQPAADSDSHQAPANSTPAATPAAQAKPKAPAEEQKNTRKSGPVLLTYSLTDNYSVDLDVEWVPTKSNDIPPPAPLATYAPFHLSGNLVMANAARGAILQFAISNNPFVGHDSYWLDTQMHSSNGSGGSGLNLLDMFFYYFFPPSDACMHEVLTTYAPASRVSIDDGPAYMQVYYSCPLSDTLSDFYASQVSAGVTFQHTDDGNRVLAPVGDFYIAPMEQVDESGMTFFVFEAQGMNAVSSDAARRFHLPDNAQGGQPDFFWAIGAPSPFPFVDDPSRKDVAILHVAYARLGVDADAKAEFMNILHEIRMH